MFAEIPARKNHFGAVTFVCVGRDGEVRSRPFGSSGDGGDDRDRCLSREGERRSGSYPFCLNTSITDSDERSALGSEQLCRASAGCLLLVCVCNAQQQKNKVSGLAGQD